MDKMVRDFFIKKQILHGKGLIASMTLVCSYHRSISNQSIDPHQLIAYNPTKHIKLKVLYFIRFHIINSKLALHLINLFQFSKPRVKMKVHTDDSCKLKFDQLKFRKIQARYIVYQIVHEKIVIERVGAKNQTWEQFVESLPQKEYRYCVFDFEFTNQDNMAISKIIFVNWAPDSASLKGRVLYATAKESFKSYLDLNTKDFVICQKGELTRQDVMNQLSH